ncbi:hypothetical protein Tco_0978948 [Tanacetum coccineum]|uniref:DUF7746 domain-containing protein n=1 Tax=Tanacetum coccineum TaxID=301880 RepID=A0ABQ5EPA8_9ASTR
MTMASNAYKAHGNNELQVAKSIIAGFTGSLKAINGFDVPLPVAVCSGIDNSSSKNMNDEVQAVVDRSAYQLCDKYAKVDNNDQLRTEITALIGKKYAFKVFIDDYNLKKLLPVFTVLRLSDDPEILDSIRLAVTPIKMDTEATSA